VYYTSLRETRQKRGFLYERVRAVCAGCPASGVVSCPAGRSLLVYGSALPRCVRAASSAVGAEVHSGRGRRGVGAARRARKQDGREARRARKQDGRADARQAKGAKRRRQERHRSPCCTADGRQAHRLASPGSAPHCADPSHRAAGCRQKTWCMQ
jgi:hypothetical protein